MARLLVKNEQGGKAEPFNRVVAGVEGIWLYLYVLEK